MTHAPLQFMVYPFAISLFSSAALLAFIRLTTTLFVIFLYNTLPTPNIHTIAIQASQSLRLESVLWKYICSLLILYREVLTSLIIAERTPTHSEHVILSPSHADN